MIERRVHDGRDFLTVEEKRQAITDGIQFGAVLDANPYSGLHCRGRESPSGAVLLGRQDINRGI